MIDALRFSFMQHAILAGLFTSIVCGIIGSLVVVNRIVFISGGIAHASFGGIGIAYFMGWPVIPSTLGFSVLSSAVIAGVSAENTQRTDAAIGAIWAVGMALGIILIDLTPGYNVGLMGFLFGSILTVPLSDLWLMVPLMVLILGLTMIFYKGFLAMSFDKEFAKTKGVPVKALYFVLMVMVGLTVVMVIRVVGLILVIALLSIPPYIAEKYTYSLKGMMLLSSILSYGFILLGLYFSYVYNLSSGATIIMVAAVCFFFIFVIDYTKKKLRVPELKL